jgi:hypothetical protein
MIGPATASTQTSVWTEDGADKSEFGRALGGSTALAAVPGKTPAVTRAVPEIKLIGAPAAVPCHSGGGGNPRQLCGIAW